MIKIRIDVGDEKMYEEFNNKNCTLEETAVAFYLLEKMQQDLLAKEFKMDFEAINDDGDDEDEYSN